MSVWSKCSIVAIITAILLFLLSVIGYLFLPNIYIALIAMGACAMAILGIVMGYIGFYRINKNKEKVKGKK